MTKRTSNSLSIMFRYLDFHLDHSNGRIFQYVNEHVNAYEQVLLCIIFYIVSFEVNSHYFPKEGCFPCKCLWTGVVVHNFDSIMLALRVILIIFPRKDVYVKKGIVRHTPPGPFLLVGMIDKFYVMWSVSLRLQVTSFICVS